MDKITLPKGKILHNKEDKVSKLEIILGGEVVLTNGNNVKIRMGLGTMIGAIYEPDEEYGFTYMVSEDATLIVYDYSDDEDLVEVLKHNAAAAGSLVQANIDFSCELIKTLTDLEEEAENLCKELKYNYNDYKFLCVKANMLPQVFVFIDTLLPLEPSQINYGWEAQIIQAFSEHGASLKETFYPLDISFCIEAFMRASATGKKLRKAIEAAADYLSATTAGATFFLQAFYEVKSAVDGLTREITGDVPTITGALDIILNFSGVDSDIADKFRADIKQYIDVPDRRAKSDEMRTLRLSIANNYYAIYEAAFLRSMDTDRIPAEVMMFFYFGFVDETLAGADNTAQLYSYAVNFAKDPDGKILTLYDWLVNIYKGVCLPSKNEFDNDWPEYLREEQRTGAITKDEAANLLTDTKAMVHFEINNMFKLANRITSERLSSFVPVFSAQDVIRPLDKCLASAARVREAFTKVTDIDFGCFFRPVASTFPDLKITHYYYNEEIFPYIILMPNFGTRGSMWQEIEGVRRNTPAHILLSVFHGADLDETVINLCAQFRWEMCRRIQGIRYMDITDLSLTSEYMQYLQFFKKNSQLSADMKERVKLELQKARNDYKRVFISDYMKYIINEANGLPQLNKVARGILFRYCTLSKKYRTSLSTNPQFSPLLERWRTTQEAKIHSLDLMIHKIKRMKPNDEVPKEFTGDLEFLHM